MGQEHLPGAVDLDPYLPPPSEDAPGAEQPSGQGGQEGWSDEPIAVPPLASGAVALRRAAAAPTPIKAVISGHSLHATDAAWTIGHGPALVGTADQLIRFLAGIGHWAPRPARPDDLGDAEG